MLSHKDTLARAPWCICMIVHGQVLPLHGRLNEVAVELVG